MMRDFPGALVCEWEEGAIEVYYRGERLVFIARAIVVRKSKHDHPWRQGY